MSIIVEGLKVFGSLIIAGSILYGAKKIGDIVDLMVEPKEKDDALETLMTNYYEDESL